MQPTQITRPRGGISIDCSRNRSSGVIRPSNVGPAAGAAVGRPVAAAIENEFHSGTKRAHARLYLLCE